MLTLRSLWLVRYRASAIGVVLIPLSCARSDAASGGAAGAVGSSAAATELQPSPSRVAVPEPSIPANAAPPSIQASPAIRRACADICDRSRQLHCSRVDDCMPNCLATATVTPCAREFGKFYDCLVGEPVEHWECAGDGVAAIRVGFCAKEQEQAVTCMEARMRP